MTISWIPSTTPGADVSRTIVLYGCSIARGNDFNTLQTSSSYIIFSWQTKHVLRMSVFDVHNSHTWTRNNSRAIRERRCQVCFTASNFNRNCPPLSCGAAWRYALAVGQGLYGFNPTDLQRTMRKRCGSGRTRHVQEGGLNLGDRLHDPSVAGSNWYWYFLVGTPHWAPPRAIENRVARLQAVVTTVDVTLVRHVRENSVRRTVVCLEMDAGRFENPL
jgi:hypothetical protein